MATSPLLEGYVDYKGNQLTKVNRFGGWKSAILVLGMEIAESFVYFGITINLINYLTGSLHISTAAAAENINVFSGVASLLPLLGAIVADIYLGRYRMILISTFLILAALMLISISAALPSLHPPDCEHIRNVNGSCIAPSMLQSLFFFFSLYLLALGHGGLRPSAQAFATDQFDVMDPQESRCRSSFFNWLVFGGTIGAITGAILISSIEEQVGWGFGFVAPCFPLVLALSIFMLRRRSYRYGLKREVQPLLRLLKGLSVVVVKSSSSSYSKNGERNLHFSGVDETCLLQSTTNQPKDCMVWEQCDCCPSSVKEMQEEETKGILQLLPIWVTFLIYPIVIAQRGTFFIQQRTSMDRRIFSDYQVPSTTFQCVFGLTILIEIAIYDRILVPAARRFTGIASGITVLQRIGTGMFLSIIALVVAGLVEMRRLRIAREGGLDDLPMAIVPMSAWWSVPQLFLLDTADVFALVGFQEFFYEQVPDGLQIIGLSLSFGLHGIGNLLSGFLLFVVDKLSTDITGESWLSDNLNRAHLDYLFLLLAGLSILEFSVFLVLARRYVYKNGRS